MAKPFLVGTLQDIVDHSNRNTTQPAIAKLMSGDIKSNSKKENKMTNINSAIAKMESVGIPVSLDRHTASWFQLSLSDDRKELYIAIEKENEDDVQVISVSKKFRQVLLAVKEPARNLYSNTLPVKLHSTLKGKSQAQLKKLYLQHKGPAGTYLKFFIGHSGRVIGAQVAGGTQKFLIGYDEKHLFVSLLTDATVKTVAEAHRSLIPKQVRGKKYLRQGEFFFLPVSKKQIEAVFDQDKGEPAVKTGLMKDNEESDHIVDISYISYLVEGTTEFAMGRVMNARHKTIDLNGWHQVFVANEASADGIWD